MTGLQSRRFSPGMSPRRRWLSRGRGSREKTLWPGNKSSWVGLYPGRSQAGVACRRSAPRSRAAVQRQRFRSATRSHPAAVVSSAARSHPAAVVSSAAPVRGAPMTRTRPESAPALRIEVEKEWAWCGARRLTLTPRAFALLLYLVEHRERLITKDELLATVWRHAVVSDAALSSCIRDVRKALGDSTDAPRYVQTVHRRGFRFIGPVCRLATAVPTARAAAPEVGPHIQCPASSNSSPAAPTLVGREGELASLHARLARALSGERQDRKSTR